MNRIYRKTAQGSDEIASRRHGLPPRLRNLLLLADGRRTVADLRALVPNCDDALATLAARGLIETVAPAAPRAAPAPAPAAPDLAALRREMVRTLTDAAGPAAEPLALRIERTRSAAELSAQLEPGSRLLLALRGRDAAAAWMQRFSARLAPPAEAVP